MRLKMKGVRGVLRGYLPQPAACVKALLFYSAVARETPQCSDPRPSQISAESPCRLCCRGKISEVMHTRTMAI